MSDAGYMDGEPGPLAIRAEDEGDLRILSALVQDAVLPGTEIAHDTTARHLALLINRFRWEDAAAAERENRPYERVRALLVIRDVLRVLSDGVARDADTVLELLAIGWEPGSDGAGRILLEFAGDGTIAVDVEAVNCDLRDVTRPYIANSGQRPSHPD